MFVVRVYVDYFIIISVRNAYYLYFYIIYLLIY